MSELKDRIESIKNKLQPDTLKTKIAEIEKESGNPAFWQDQGKAAEKMKQLAWLQKDLDEIAELESLLDLGKTEELNGKLNKLELKTYLSGKYDNLPAIVAIHAGQGGVEAMDWAAMLQRMYTRYFEKQKWNFELVDETPGEEAGIKNVTYTVNAPYAYGYLRREAGTHRLVRQSPFNADKLRQTSFALVEVLPQIENPEGIDVREEDLEWQFYHSAGHGGQNVQKVATAVRLKHKPSGIIVTCQTERYQEQNRKNALNLLKAKLWELEESKKADEEHQLRGGRTKASWGTQIRSYVLHPYKMVKDVRTDVESNNPDAVLDGSLEEFISAELKNLD
jgi:peptide chain release factor 2